MILEASCPGSKAGSKRGLGAVSFHQSIMILSSVCRSGARLWIQELLSVVREGCLRALSTVLLLLSPERAWSISTACLNDAGWSCPWQHSRRLEDRLGVANVWTKKIILKIYGIFFKHQYLKSFFFDIWMLKKWKVSISSCMFSFGKKGKMDKEVKKDEKCRKGKESKQPEVLKSVF